MRLLLAGDREGFAWAAGIVDGEGHFGTHGGAGRRNNPSLEVTQNDPEMLIRFQAITDLGKVRGPYGPYAGRTSKPFYRYTVLGFEGVQAVTAMLWPWLGSIKREQASRALVQFRLAWRPYGWHQAAKTHCPKGHPYAGDNLIILGGGRGRRCRECANAPRRKGAPS